MLRRLGIYLFGASIVTLMLLNVLIAYLLPPGRYSGPLIFTAALCVGGGAIGILLFKRATMLTKDDISDEKYMTAAFSLFALLFTLNSWVLGLWTVCHFINIPDIENLLAIPAIFFWYAMFLVVLS